MFKGRFEVSYGIECTGYHEGIRIVTSKRDFIFIAENIYKRNEWVEAIQQAYSESEWTMDYIRFDSSFPVREDNYCKWFADAENYYKKVY